MKCWCKEFRNIILSVLSNACCYELKWVSSSFCATNIQVRQMMECVEKNSVLSLQYTQWHISLIIMPFCLPESFLMLLSWFCAFISTSIFSSTYCRLQQSGSAASTNTYSMACAESGSEIALHWGNKSSNSFDSSAAWADPDIQDEEAMLSLKF